MAGDAIEYGSHVDRHAPGRELFLENAGAIGFREYCLFERLADLAGVDIEGCDRTQILNPVATDFGVDDSCGFIDIVFTIELDALEKGACAVAHADDGDSNFVQGPTLSRAADRLTHWADSGMSV